MTHKRRCPNCGRTTYIEHDLPAPPVFSCGCGWEEGNELEYGHLTMTERPAMPLDLEGDRIDPAIAAELDRCGL